MYTLNLILIIKFDSYNQILSAEYFNLDEFTLFLLISPLSKLSYITVVVK